MIIYNYKCPTINHSLHYDIYNKLNNIPKNEQTYQNISEPQILNYDITKLEERKISHHIYYTLNADESFDFLDKYKPDELIELQNNQTTYIKQHLETLIEFKHISKASADTTLQQYTKLLFINWLWFDNDYVNEIIKTKQKLITDDYITTYQPPVQQTKQHYQIDRQVLQKIAWYSPYVEIDWQTHYLKWQDDYINDTSRFIYILWSRQLGKSLATAYIAFENSFIPNQKILVSSFSANSTNNMRDYILEFIENTPPLDNWQEAFTFHAKEAFVINNLTKSKIFFRTLADEWKWIRWMKLNLVIIDEAAFVANEIYERVLRPTTTTTKWRIIALSTPEKKNWFYEKVMEAMKEIDNPNSNISLYEVDYTKNPFVYADEDLLSYILENKHKASVRQEYMCQFIWEEDEIFQINLANFYPQLHNSAFYTLSYDPARKWKDQAAYALSIVFQWKATLLLSWYIPQKEKTEWYTQAKFLKEIQDKYNAKVIMDVTWVWDWVINIMKQHWLKVHMAIQYANSTSETLDKTYPYQWTKCYKVWKWILINRTIDFCDEEILQIYEYTNKPLLKEIWQLTKIKNKLWQILFESAFFDDATNAMLLNVYYIYQENLLSKTVKETQPYDAYDPKTYHYHKKPVWRNF